MRICPCEGGVSLSSRFKFLLIAVLTALLFLGLIAFFFPYQHPPLQSLENAKSALNQAVKAFALHYAEQPCRSAEKLLQNGWMEMARQNGRLAPFRDYKVADSLLHLATQMAQAVFQAKERIRYLDSLAQNERADLQNELLLCREALDGSSWANFKAERYWSFAEISLKTSELLANQGEYEEAQKTATKEENQSISCLPFLPNTPMMKQKR